MPHAADFACPRSVPCACLRLFVRPLARSPARRLALAIGLVAGITLNLIGAALALPLYPWINLVALVVAWSGGLLLGRSIAPRFRPFLLLLLCLSVGDVLVTAAVSPLAPHPVVGATPLRFGDFLLALPWGRFDIGLLDLLLLTALAEHWRRRGSGYPIALLPGVLGFMLAAGVVLVTRLGILPGIPFFTAGYLCAEGLYRYASHHRATTSRTRSLVRHQVHHAG